MDTDALFVSANPENKLLTKEAVVTRADPLALDIDDEDLVRNFDKLLEDERKFYKNKYDLYNTRKKNELYYFGRQIAELEKANKLKDYEAKNLDNVLYEIEATIKPLAMSQLPDLIVTPGNESDQSHETAQLLSQAVDNDVKRRNNRKVLALAFKHRPVYRIGVIKAIWNPELAGGMGDYEFLTIHPDYIDFDYNASDADADKMMWVSQLVKISIQQVLMRYPEAKDEFIRELQKEGIKPGDDGEIKKRDLATNIEIREIWFTWYEKAEGDKWERIEGVMWKYKDVILKKMKNPNFDYEGEESAFTYEDPMLKSSKRPVTMEEMQTSFMTGQTPPNVKFEQVYHNYFKMPRKPFFFMVYDQWGKQPLDETTSLEQNIKNQQMLDNRDKNIEEKLNQRGHHVWSKESGLQPKDIEKMDHNNPDEDYLVDGDVEKVHAYIAPEIPPRQEFEDRENIRNRMYAISGSTAIRGQMQSQVATTNQIAREANYTRADDLVDETVNPAAEWMAQWALQFIKLRYTQDHFRWLLGKKGELVYLTLHRNLVEEGMEVMIKASGTDKIKAQNNAMEQARMQLIDPLNFYRDMGLDDPEGRTMSLVAFNKDPMMYLSQFVVNTGNVTQDLINKLQMMTPQMPQPPQGNGVGMPSAPPMVPQQPTPANTGQAPVQPPVGIQASPNNASSQGPLI